MDKGGTVVVYPLPDVDDLTVLGEASTPLTIADDGESGRATYTRIAAPNAKIVITKTQAGSTTSYMLSIRGAQE